MALTKILINILSCVSTHSLTHSLRHLQHKNIIKFLGVEKGNGVFRLLMECIPGGSLTDLLNKFGPLIDNFQYLIDYSGQVGKRVD